MDLNKYISKICRFIKRKATITSDEYLDSLRNKGITIGERTIVFDPESVVIDTQQPSLVEIGNDVQITHGVIILTHGYDWSVIKRAYGEVLGSRGKVKIGNNVFIGMNSIILKGVTIGDNVIIGAGSVVTKDIPPNTVYAGAPARFICDLKEYYNKRKTAQLDEAKNLAISYMQKNSVDPPVEMFWEFFWLFAIREQELPEKFLDTLKLTGNFNVSHEIYKNSSPKFNGFEKFIEFCKDELKKSGESTNI